MRTLRKAACRSGTRRLWVDCLVTQASGPVQPTHPSALGWFVVLRPVPSDICNSDTCVDTCGGCQARGGTHSNISTFSTVTLAFQDILNDLFIMKSESLSWLLFIFSSLRAGSHTSPTLCVSALCRMLCRCRVCPAPSVVC